METITTIITITTTMTLQVEAILELPITSQQIRLRTTIITTINPLTTAEMAQVLPIITMEDQVVAPTALAVQTQTQEEIPRASLPLTEVEIQVETQVAIQEPQLTAHLQLMIHQSTFQRKRTMAQL